jgi:hypothetical protein
VAQSSLPSYVVSVHDGNGDHLRPALASEYPDKDPASKAQKFRHRYRDLMAILGGMLVLLMTAVIVILRKRDNDLQ